MEQTDGDVLREMVQTFAEALMDVEVSALCNADYRERTPERTNARNGHRSRRWATRVGTIAVAIPTVRTGRYFPEWRLEPRRRAERAVVAVIAERSLAGVRPRRVAGLVQTRGIASIATSQGSQLARSLDETVTAFRTRPLEGGPSPYPPYRWLAARTETCREGGRIGKVATVGATVVATGVNADGHREVRGVAVITTEDGAGWTAFLRALVARGLGGVQRVVSDAQQGLPQAIGAVLPGARWQRCRTHVGWNRRTRVPKAAQNLVGSLVRSIVAQPDAARVWAPHARIVTELTDRFPAAADLLAEAAPDRLACTACTAVPAEHWRQIWSNNPQERLNRAIRRRTDGGGIVPNRAAIVRLVGASLAEQHDAWAIGRRSISVASLSNARLTAAHATLEESMSLPAAG